VIDGATTRLLATARRAGSTKTEGGLQRIRLARTTVRALGLLADLALALATVALALATRTWRFAQRTTAGVGADALRTTTRTARVCP
jgi:hypothetical protein